ncbi:hypothetical protein SAMN04489798_4535 [Pseudomonas arsenicoxydans]|uniref:Uncharacterized protein n=1 Tax=Pseudomonas arsenicoxydans TaxID=702115 RepID=A0A1H0PGX5_9PSED|nr:hypothetical protein SAMN04489798_4535 [Pseudomonas arsenicoxydans]
MSAGVHRARRGRLNIWFGLLPGLVLLLSACSWAGSAVRDSVEGVASYYGREHFTLVVSVPPNFGFTSKAQYSPKAGQDCEVYSPGLGGSVTRQQQKSDKFPAKNVKQTVATDIPLEYHIAGCSMALTRVDYEVNATYGPGSWDHGLDHAGGLSIIAPSTNDNSNPSLSIQEQHGLCTWLFQISTAKAKKENIEKILSCSAADEHWRVPSKYIERRKPGSIANRDQLNKNTVYIIFRLSEDDEPSMDNRWIKTASGWKPCQGTSTSDRCTSPPIFKNFKSNGRECTVYPNCAEHGTSNE